ncbi:MAG: hypothetical protein AAGD32_02370 [Planctomycetota bacterium]
MNLAAEIEKFDGVHTDVLESAALRWEPTAADVRLLLKLGGDADVNRAVGASWLLKDLAGRGYRLTAAQSKTLLGLLDDEKDWQMTLHLVQAFPAVKVTRATADAWHARLAELAAHPQNFVRAWSFNALALLATTHERFRPDVADRLEVAGHNDAASVRARIRNVTKTTPWLRD